MSARILIPALLLYALPSAAQDAVLTEQTLPARQPTAERRHDISLFSLYGGPLQEGSGTFWTHGAIYRWAKPRTSHTFWKAGAGIGNSFDVTSRRTLPVSSDSAVVTELWKDERVYMMLAGVETQRHLWRGIHLTAGLEAQAGGSGGRLDSVARRAPTDASDPYNGDVIGSPARLADTRRFFGSGLGVLGIRAYTGRFTAAIEAYTGVGIAASTQKRAQTDATILDLKLGGGGYRFSLGYRF